MKYLERFQNKTLGKVIEVHTDNGFCEGCEVFTDKEKEMGRDGHRMNAEQTNKLFAYYNAAGHMVE